MTDIEIKRLAEEYEFSEHLVKGWYELLKEFPCFYEEKQADCLELLCQRRTSCTIEIDGKKPYSEPLFISIDYCLYDVYGEDSYPYLTNKFCEMKEIHNRTR